MKRWLWVAMVASACGGDDASGDAESNDESGVDDGDDDGDGVPADPSLDDEFEGGALSGWEVVNAGSADVRVANGNLLIEPHANSLWFNASAGVLVAKRITGDFVVTAPVRARSLSDPSQPPSPLFRLGGLMARDPGGAAEDYVFIVLGADAEDVSVETKSTDDSVSMYEGPPWPSGEGSLRICRQGSRFTLLVREATGAWTEQAAFDRPDLPETVQVGPTAYANADPADLQVGFDAVRFAALAGSCTDE
jgi:hypothetical protein